mmetsp:Transcript_9178/g.16919  ORF Transcript_9178/g.16919 Transcript_9178/m.16919 type:complete len:118 (+) Transcript_9178:2-355(+)
MPTQDWALGMSEVTSRCLQTAGAGALTPNLILLTIVFILPCFCACCYVQRVKSSEKDLPQNQKVMKGDTELGVYLLTCCCSFCGLFGAFLYVNGQQETLKELDSKLNSKRYPVAAKV